MPKLQKGVKTGDSLRLPKARNKLYPKPAVLDEGVIWVSGGTFGHTWRHSWLSHLGGGMLLAPGGEGPAVRSVSCLWSTGQPTSKPGQRPTRNYLAPNIHSATVGKPSPRPTVLKFECASEPPGEVLNLDLWTLTSGRGRNPTLHF